MDVSYCMGHNKTKATKRNSEVHQANIKEKLWKTCD
jgi:hypothetical protein